LSHSSRTPAAYLPTAKAFLEDLSAGDIIFTQQIFPRKFRKNPFILAESIHAACLQGHSVLFTTAVEAINTLIAAQAQCRLKAELKKFLAPTLVIVDELGYLPIDKAGADLLFQIISGRYEKGSTVITTNLAYKNWPRIFNNDSTITSAVLDRLLHHAETVVIEGKSYRMKDKLTEE